MMFYYHKTSVLLDGLDTLVSCTAFEEISLCLCHSQESWKRRTLQVTTTACILIFPPSVPPSVSSAVEQGTQMLEMDCHLTHDGHVVASHDENLLRQTGHDATISSLKLQVGGRMLVSVWIKVTGSR